MAISATSINLVLAGADNDENSTTDNGILFGGSTILPTNGSYSVVVNDDDEDDDGISCPGDADDELLDRLKRQGNCHLYRYLSRRQYETA